MNNQNKKVLLIITKSNFGGAQKYVFELAQGLKSSGFDVCIALGGDGILIEKLKDAHISTLQLESLERDVSLFKDIKTFFALLKIIRSFKPYIVHLNSSKIGGIGALAARVLFVPKIIFTIHGWAFNEDRGRLSKSIIKFIYFITLFFSHVSIAVSKKIKAQAAEIPFFPLIKNKIEVIHNGVIPPQFLSKEDARAFISEKINRSLEDKKVIGQIAELHPIKSVETTIKGARKLVQKNKDLVFVIMGDGEQRQKLQILIDSYSLNEHVFLLGFVDNADQYIKGFDVFCLTSKSEALALVLLEAGLAEVPVVASEVGGIPELITDSETGFLFESQDTDIFIQTVEKVLSLSDEEKLKITENFFQKIHTQFSIELMLDKTISLYQS